MDLSGTSIGIVGALKAFPLRAAARHLEGRGARVHRGLPRGTGLAVFCRSLLERLSPSEVEARVAAARATVPQLGSENALMRRLGQMAAPAPGALARQSLLEQSGLAAATLDLLALFDAFEHDREPFSFRDLILARKYAGLLAAGAGWHDIARAVHDVGPVGSLTALTLQTRGEKIVTQDAHSLADLGGQRLLALPDHDDEAEDDFGHAETAEAAGLLAEAATLYAHCAAIDRSDATAPFNQGNCLRQLGDLDGAALAYAHALKRDPLFAEAWFNQAGVLRDQGKVAVARQHLLHAMALDGGYADAVYNLAALEYEAGDLSAASTLWRRYLELDDSSEWARRARAGLSVIKHTQRLTG